MTYDQLSDVFVELTFLLRGYDYSDEESIGQSLIKLAYQENSIPFQDLVDEISYVWVNYADSSTNSQISEENKYDSLGDSVKSTKKQLRNLDVHWTFYGRKAQDIAYMFRQNLFSVKAKDFLDKYSVKLITNIPEVVLFYEEVNKVWWPRIDIVVRYYISTEIVEDVNYYDKFNVELNTEKEVIIIKEDE